MKDFVLKHENFAPFEWSNICRKLGLDESKWITEIKIPVDIDNIEVSYPETSISWEDAEEIVKTRYGDSPYIKLTWDDIQKGYWIHWGCTGKFFTEKELIALKEDNK